jgi:hypothetical protein
MVSPWLSASIPLNISKQWTDLYESLHEHRIVGYRPM